MKHTLTHLAALLLAPPAVLHGEIPTVEETAAATRWAQSIVFAEQATQPLGDYYPLTPYSLDKTSWIAWQFHRADWNQGVVQAFRRPEAANETLIVKLCGLDPQQRYEIENLDGGKVIRTGAELMRGLDITLREKADAVTGGAKRLLHPPFTGAAVLFLHRPTQP